MEMHYFDTNLLYHLDIFGENRSHSSTNNFKSSVFINVNNNIIQEYSE